MKKQGKIILITIFIAAALLATACGNTATAEQTEQAAEAAQTQAQTETLEISPLFGEFITQDSNGNEVTQDIFAGHKLTMVNIWATFCGPCLREMPELGELNQEYQDQGFQVVGMPTDVMDQAGTIDQEQVDVVNEIAEKTGADYPHILPSKELVEDKLGSISVVPETVFVDEHGNQVGPSYKGARDKAAWKEIIDSLLASMPNEPAAQA